MNVRRYPSLSFLEQIVCPVPRSVDASVTVIVEVDLTHEDMGPEELAPPRFDPLEGQQ